MGIANERCAALGQLRIGSRLSISLLLMLLLSACASMDTTPGSSPAAAALEPPISSAEVALNPLILHTPQAPQAIPASDGRTHLVYEVLATNITRHALRVQSIVVHAADSRRVLVQHAGAALAQRMSLISDWTQPVDTLPPGMTATLWIDVALESGVPVPTMLDTRVEVAAAAASDPPVSEPLTHVLTSVNQTRPRVLHPPLAGDLWLAIEGCCDASNHHRRGQRSVDGHLVLPERYAIDFIQVDKQLNLFDGSDSNENYFSFGQPVLAVADATVIDVYDKLADIPPRAPLPLPRLPEAGGNHVILDLGDGVWAMYGHLRAGSILVRQGDRVRAGQALAALGNNGNSDLPHLHFQLMNTRNFAQSEGLPFVFDHFVLVGSADMDAEKIIPAADLVPRTDELPLTLSIVNFRAVEH